MTTPPGDQPPYGEQQPNQPPYQPGPQQGGYQQSGYQGGYQQGPPPFSPYGPGYPVYPGPPDHPKAQTAMVLGILGLVMCQVAAPFAWVIGKRTVAEIDASGGMLGGRSSAQAGYILGLIGTVLLGLGVAFLIFYFVIVIVVIGGMAVGS